MRFVAINIIMRTNGLHFTFILHKCVVYALLCIRKRALVHPIEDEYTNIAVYFSLKKKFSHLLRLWSLELAWTALFACKIKCINIFVCSFGIPSNLHNVDSFTWTKNFLNRFFAPKTDMQRRKKPTLQSWLKLKTICWLALFEYLCNLWALGQNDHWPSF